MAKQYDNELMLMIAGLNDGAVSIIASLMISPKNKELSIVDGFKKGIKGCGRLPCFLV